jgi:carotenoid cleavage dioxygenase
MMRREQIFKWEPNLNTRFAIIPRHGNNDDVVWFEDESCMGFHVVNAREQGDKIILDMVVMDDIPQDVIAFTDDSVTYVNYFTRWIFDLKKRKITKERLDDINVEFPRIDKRFVGRNNCHVYMNGTIVDNKISTNLFDSIIHSDMKNHKKQIHNFGYGSSPLEPIFVPRSVDSHEGNGFLLSYVYREALNRSDLVILDAQHANTEPLAIVQLPHRIPFGFHGCWAEGIRA